MPTRHYCTYFDGNYLLRGLTLYRSLQSVSRDFVLHVLALDEVAKRILDRMNEPGILAYGLEQVEAWDTRLRLAKANRSVVEYYFTLSPAFPLFLLEQGDRESITYLDADLCFFSDPQVVFDELGTRSILVTEHRYSSHLHDQGQYGRYNVQFQVFRNDDIGRKCLRRWHEQCLEWCYDRVEGNRYADQRYLDEWPSLYGDALVVSSNLGVGVAPWNWRSASLECSHSGVRVGGGPIVFYHFHGVKFFSPYFISNGLKDWGMMPWLPRRRLYAGYVREVRETRNWVRERTGIDLRIRDTIRRGKGLSAGAMGEILRKAWSQSMVVF